MIYGAATGWAVEVAITRKLKGQFRTTAYLYSVFFSEFLNLLKRKCITAAVYLV